MVTLYHVAGSRSMRTLWLLHELAIPFEVVAMPFKMSALRHPDYLAVHPLGRVPALKHEGRVLFESGAVAQYLTHHFPVGGLGRAPEDPEWGEWLQWIHYAETIAVHGASLVQQRVFIKPEDRSPAVADLEGKRLVKALEVLDAHVKGRDFMLAGGFSAADTSIGYSVHLAKSFAPFEAMPNLAAYYDRISARPAFVATLASDSAMPAPY